MRTGYASSQEEALAAGRFLVARAERQVAAPPRVNKAVATNLAGLAARVMLLITRRTVGKAVTTVKGLDAKALMAGAALGELASQVFDSDTAIPELAQDAGEAVAGLIRGSGESFGLGGADTDTLRYLSPRTVAIYIGRRLFTVVREEAAQMVLDGMKRNVRRNVRVR